MKSIIIIGNSKPPINGVTIILDLITNLLKKNNIKVKHVRTNTSSNLENFSFQGELSFRKIIVTIRVFIYGALVLICNPKIKRVYMVPGESYNGFFRYTIFMRICRFFNKKYYLHFHGQLFIDNCKNINKRKLDFILNNLLRAEKIIVLGETYVHKFVEVFPEIADKIFICYNGISKEYLIDSNEIQDKINLKGSVCKILYLGNLIRSKGILDLLDAIRILIENYSFNFTLSLCGDIEPEIRDDIMDFVSRYPAKIKYHGRVNGEMKKKILKESHIFCLPTYMPSEAQPISILEAMASGCAIVTTDQGGIRDIFKDKYNGFYCEKHNSQSIVEKVIATNLDYPFFVKNNHFSVKDMYSEESFFNRFYQIILKD